MAKAFSIRDYIYDNVRQQDSDAYEKVSIYDIESNPDNDYELSEIEKMKDSIFALGGVQQNIVLVKCPENADHKYLALDGHRRLAASRGLVEEGYKEFEFIPAVIKGQIDNGMDMAVLVMMNSTQRNKTDWERVMEHMKLKEIIPMLKKRQGIDGRTRDIEADMLGVSQTQIGVYNMIGTRLNADLMEMFRIGRIGISLAYACAKQELYIQDKLVDLASKKGSITEEDIKQLSGSRECKEPQKMPTTKFAKENVSDSDTSGKTKDELGVKIYETKNVSESDTHKAPQITLNECDETISELTIEEDVPNTSNESNCEKQDAKFRGGYELILVDDLAKEYVSYLEMAMGENRENQIHKYNCLLDALDLLRERLNSEGSKDDI